MADRGKMLVSIAIYKVWIDNQTLEKAIAKPFLAGYSSSRRWIMNDLVNGTGR
jgi:hypothetical protein